MPALMLGAVPERVRLAVSFAPETHGSEHIMSLCGPCPAIGGDDDVRESVILCGEACR